MNEQTNEQTNENLNGWLDVLGSTLLISTIQEVTSGLFQLQESLIIAFCHSAFHSDPQEDNGFVSQPVKWKPLLLLSK